MKKIALILGTRPEAIKLAPLALEGKNLAGYEVKIWNTGQHRDMVKPMLEAFSLTADIDLELMIPGQSPASFFAKAVASISQTLQQEKPDAIFVQGDTSTAAAASVAAFFEKIPLAHIEAGLRTHDLQSPWPEEYNRRLIAISARWHFAPTQTAKENLLQEQIPAGAILVTGNTGIDALLWMVQKLRGEAGKIYARKWTQLHPQKKLVLCTLHRREAFGETMRAFMRSLAHLASTTEAQFILPLHPNPEVQKAAQAAFGSNPPNSLFVVPPLEYQEFIWLMDRAALLISDSGGVQEEAPTLGKPVIVTRDKTERPEAVQAGSNILAGTNADIIMHHVRHLLDDENALQSMSVPRPVYGDGRAAQKIFQEVIKTI